MTRLEFLAMSLTKGIKGVIYIDGEQEIVTLKSIDTDGNEIWVSNDNWVYSSLNYDIKIICRKLTDLTKPIEHKGEKFVPEENLLDSEMILRNADYRMLRFGDIERLISWHFDLFGWIDSGDAIDVNSLSENPYK